MQDFDYQLRPRIIFGDNCIERLGPLAREWNASKVLVVSDAGVVQAGLFERGLQSLLAAQLEVRGFHDFSENPSSDHVDAGVQVARAFQPDLIVGLGGGSSMDCAKGINFVYSCGGRIQDYWGVGKASQSLLPMIAVPTTSGTGSETQSFALISDSKTHVKMACGDPKAACKVALLDPQLTLTQPPRVTALTGIDALTHALETYVCNKRNGMSECYSMEAWARLSASFSRVLLDPNDLPARSNMQLGASFAGMAIESSMLGAAHALANPITAMFGTPHGQAVGMMMPHVIRFNAPVVGDRYRRLALGAGWEETPSPQGLGPNVLSNEEGSERLIAHWYRWLAEASLSTNLSQLDGWQAAEKMGREPLLAELAEGAAKQWTATFNPRPVTVDDLLHMYREAC